ncbi:hypothetical protein EDC94DRAFT_594881 [Helicostylum pulchrum]|nr:hypothetical protein EDC94DRAFT_594881 [Helicostylum pulchrum]
MGLFSTEKLRAVLKRSKSSKIFLGLALLQLVAALAFLIPALLNIQTMYDYRFDNSLLELAGKAFKVSGECIMLIALEVWKLSLALDGVRHSNSRTMWASASFTIFSFGFSIMMVIEYIKWIEVDKELEMNNILPESVGVLKRTNLNLLIALSCILFLIIPATFYTAVKVAKDFGWDAYKKIGSSIKIQKMYVTVQWFSLALKIDAYFEFCAYGLYFFYLVVGNYNHDDAYYTIFSIVLSIWILTIPSLILSRYAIGKESKILMILFILLQLLFIASVVYVAKTLYFVVMDWYAVAAFCLASLIAAIGSIVLSIMCLLNFNKGLKEFVQWKPFSRKTSRGKSAIYSNVDQADTVVGLEAQRAEEPIDD